VHDAFTPFEIINTEDLGFFPPGKGGRAVEAGKTSLEGALPINPSGGLKSRGHPVGASGAAQVVEVVRRLRGEAKGKIRKEAKRGLAQSMGGLAANNFVTIVERADSSARAQNLWAPPPSPPIRQRRAPAESQTPPSDEGRIETFTILYITPDGFLPPLALALIRDSQGRLLMAQGEDIGHLKIGRAVYLRQVGDCTLFTVKSHLLKVREAMRKLLSRIPSLPRKSETAPRKKENL